MRPFWLPLLLGVIPIIVPTFPPSRQYCISVFLSACLLLTLSKSRIVDGEVWWGVYTICWKTTGKRSHILQAGRADGERSSSSEGWLMACELQVSKVSRHVELFPDATFKKEAAAFFKIEGYW